VATDDAQELGELGALAVRAFRLLSPANEQLDCPAALLTGIFVQRHRLDLLEAKTEISMIDNFDARLLLWIRYRSRSLATNVRQFNAAAAAIEAMVAATPEPILRGRRPVPPLPGVTPIMQGWSAFMTINHCNDVHEALLELIPQLEAGHEPDVGDIGRFDHPVECGPEVMPRFRDLADRITDLPQTHAFTGRGAFRHPIFGRLDSRGSYALLAFHLQLHVSQIRRSIEING
jgi:hypothetical protein